MINSFNASVKFSQLSATTVDITRTKMPIMIIWKKVSVTGGVWLKKKYLSALYDERHSGGHTGEEKTRKCNQHAWNRVTLCVNANEFGLHIIQLASESFKLATRRASAAGVLTALVLNLSHLILSL